MFYWYSQLVTIDFKLMTSWPHWGLTHKGREHKMHMEWNLKTYCTCCKCICQCYEVVTITLVVLICHVNTQIQRELCIWSMIVLLKHLFIKVVSVSLSFCELSCDPDTCRHLQRMRIYLCIYLCIIGHGGEPHWTDEHPQQDHWKTWVLFLHKHYAYVYICLCTLLAHIMESKRKTGSMEWFSVL